MFVFLLSGCSKATNDSSRHISEDQLQRIAKTYIQAHHADWGLESDPKCLIKEREKFWTVEFTSKFAAIGGGPTVDIDKKSMDVLRAYLTQ